MKTVLRRLIPFVVLCSGFVACSSAPVHDDPQTAPRDEDLLSDEQEHELGREVSAELLVRFPPVASPFNLYATRLARYLAQFSDRPITFKGYRVHAVSGGQKAAFSTPGGFIYLSQGLVKALENEDELAGVVAHEVAHVVLRHGEMAMHRSADAEKKRKFTEIGLAFVSGALAVAGQEEAGKAASSAQSFYRSKVGRIHEQLLKSGYNKNQESAADQLALRMMLDAGYDPGALGRFLSKEFSTLKRVSGAGGGLEQVLEGTLLSTHPLDEARVRAIDAQVRGWMPGPRSERRNQRFTRAKESLQP